MRVILLIVALVLLAAGLYRLFVEERAAREAQKAARKPGHPQTGGHAGGHPQSPGHAGEHPQTPRTEAARTATPAKAATPAKTATPAKAATPAADPDASKKMLPSMLQEHDADEDITIITLAPSPAVLTAMNAVAAKAKAAGAPAPAESPKPPAESSAPKATGQAGAPAQPTGPARIEHPPDDEEDAAPEAPSAIPIVYDEDASVDEPTRISPLILVSAAAQTDQGRRRRRNEDSMLVLEDHHLYVVADGMGGHAGGDVASKMAVEIIGGAFQKNAFGGDPYPDVPRRGGELALAIQMANKAIFEHARANSAYTGMGTTVVSARFSPNKQRVYFGHVGDSRCYRLRAKHLTQITTDHTMASQGVTGPLAGHLNRAVGVQPGVKVDLIIARPSAEDVYLLCSDGLSKMVPDEEIEGILNEHSDLDKAVQKLVERANARGGRDNITVVLVQVKDPKGLAKYIQDRGAVLSDLVEGGDPQTRAQG